MFRAFSASAASRPGKRARLTLPEALWLNYQWVTDYYPGDVRTGGFLRRAGYGIMLRVPLGWHPLLLRVSI